MAKIRREMQYAPQFRREYGRGAFHLFRCRLRSFRLRFQGSSHDASKQFVTGGGIRIRSGALQNRGFGALRACGEKKRCDESPVDGIVEVVGRHMSP